MSKYLERLKAKIGKAPTLGGAKSDEIKPSRAHATPIRKHRLDFDTFDTAPTKPFSKYVPPFDADGVPCGGCPSCGLGEFWRYPKFHAQHDPRGWICWFCSPPPAGSGPFDFCGVPDSQLGRNPWTP
jgi:hypothetical protein